MNEMKRECTRILIIMPKVCDLSLSYYYLLLIRHPRTFHSNQDSNLIIHNVPFQLLSGFKQQLQEQEHSLTVYEMGLNRNILPRRMFWAENN